MFLIQQLPSSLPKTETTQNILERFRNMGRANPSEKTQNSKHTNRSFTPAVLNLQPTGLVYALYPSRVLYLYSTQQCSSQCICTAEAKESH